jgi:hypothetical protein
VNEKQKYRKVLNLAWYVDNFNHKEIAHRFLAHAYLNDRQILGEDFNISYVVQGLKWAKADMRSKESKHRNGMVCTSMAESQLAYNDGEAAILEDEHLLSLTLLTKRCPGAYQNRLRILKLKMAGFSDLEIGQQINMKKQNVNRVLLKMIRNYGHN